MQITNLIKYISNYYSLYFVLCTFVVGCSLFVKGINFNFIFLFSFADTYKPLYNFLSNGYQTDTYTPIYTNRYVTFYQSQDYFIKFIIFIFIF